MRKPLASRCSARQRFFLGRSKLSTLDHWSGREFRGVFSLQRPATVNKLNIDSISGF